MTCHSENCRVSDKGVQQLYKMQLTELSLGSAPEKADRYNNTFTKDSFTALLSGP
jgi:hypothetical protein